MRASSSVHIKDLFASVFDAESILAYVDGQTKAVFPGGIPIVDADGGIATGSPLHSARLRAGPRWVRTPVLSMGDPEVGVVGLDLDTLDGFDGVRDVGIVDERAVPNKEAISI